MPTIQPSNLPAKDPATPGSRRLRKRLETEPEVQPMGGAATTGAEGSAFADLLRERDPEALGAFFERHFDRVYGYVRRLVGDDHLAEDLTQDIFVNIHRGLPGFDSTRELEPWVFTIATNRIRDHWRSRGHRTSQEMASLDGEGLEELLPARSERPEQGLERKELARLIRDAIAELPEGMRRTVLLRVDEGLPFEAIGRILGRNADAARKRYSRALVALRETLGRAHPELPAPIG